MRLSITTTLVAALVGSALGYNAVAPGVVPASVSQTVKSGGSFDIKTVVNTPGIPLKPGAVPPVDITVTPHVVSCDAGLSVAFVPGMAKVPTGTPATFKETVTVASSAQLGAVLHCSVDFLLNGASGGPAFIQTISVTVADKEPPKIKCKMTEAPFCCWKKYGKGNYFVLTGTDNSGLPVEIFVHDSKSDAVFGPYPYGIAVQFIQNAKATPGAAPSKGAVKFVITLKGAPVIVGKDTFGNKATAYCPCAPATIKQLPKRSDGMGMGQDRW